MSSSRDEELARLRTLVDHLRSVERAQAVGALGSWEWDIARNRVTWSAELYRIHGLVPDEDLGPYENALTLVHPDDRPAVTAAVEGALAAGAPFSISYRIIRPDGVERQIYGRGEIVLDASGKPTSMIGTATDLTDRAQSTLETARTDLRKLLDRLPVGVAINRNGKWIYVNDAFATMLARPRESLVGHSPLDFIHEDDKAAVAERLRTVGSTAPLEPRERKYLRPDGEVRTLEIAPTRIGDFEGGPAFLVLARDLTEEKLQHARQALSERLVSIGSLAAGVAHEINNPLTYVITNLDVLAEGLQRGAVEDIDTLLAETRDGADRVRKIVRALKSLSRGGDEEQRVVLDVRRVLEVAFAMTHNEIRHRARLVKELAPVPMVRADEARLAQVFINLLVNAAQAIPEGRAEGNVITVTTRAEGDRAVVEIRDTGVGIAPEVLPRVFDPFFTTKAAGVGSGLGLSICQGIVSSLDGRIEVTTERDQGSAFRVVLPAAEGSPATARPEEVAPRSSARRARVLIVDDEDRMRSSLRRVLRDHEVTDVATAASALELIREREFDVILCDLMMPEMTGMDLYHALIRSNPGHADRVVFMTAGAFTPTASAFLDAVPNARFDKPFDSKNIRAFVERSTR